MKTTQLLIDNNDIAAEAEATFERVGPLSCAPASRAAAASVSDARRAADAAAAALGGTRTQRPTRIFARRSIGDGSAYR